jgi:PRC-barrel domain
MDIPIGAEVMCTDGGCGQTTYIVLNPLTDEVTHVVVKETNLPNIERLVSIDEIERSDHEHIYLKCKRREIEEMEPFIETDFIESNIEEYSVPFEYPYTTPFMVWPYVGLPLDVSIVRLEHVPPSELVIRRGAMVEATDGHVGEVDEFVVNAQNGHITHLVLRKGPMWGEKDVVIPVSQIDHIEENNVYLKLDKFSIASLPAFPIKRRWR